MKIRTHLDVLKQASVWRDENSVPARKTAHDLLVSGLKEFPEALPIGDELVLVLKKEKRIDDAIVLLEQLNRRFRQIGEETLCRWASIHKLRAMERMGSKAYAQAIMDCEESEKFCARAYEQHHSFYPRINELSVRFLRAALLEALQHSEESLALLALVDADLRKMLADPIVWTPRKSDDEIWSRATRGEALFLLRRWDEAESAYGEAIRGAGDKKFYSDCMADQLEKMLNPAMNLLGIPIGGKLANPNDFFRRS